MNSPAKDDIFRPLYWSDKFPELGDDPLSIEPCISQTYFDAEKAEVFKKSWLNVGRVEEMKKPGDYKVIDLPILDTSILLVRGRDSLIRAFHNMCTHRGNKLVWDEVGNNRHAMTCKFHGWVYDDKGALVDVPDERNFRNFCKGDHGLTPVMADVWQGFIFINVDPEATESLIEFLGEVVPALAGYPFEKLAVGYGYRGNLACNWKIAVDAQQDIYHSHLHRRSLGDALIAPGDGSFRALDIQLFKRHRMVSTWSNPAHRPTAVEGVAHKFGWTIKKADVGFLDRDHLPLGVNPTRNPEWGFDVYLIWPNFWIAVMDGAYQTHNFWPTGVGSMYQEIRMYTAPVRNNGQRFSLEVARCINRDTWLEDFSTLEQTQQMLRSGAKTHFILQSKEVLIRHFYKVLEDNVARVL